MHHSSPSTITYPSFPSPTTHLTALRPAPALPPALLPTSLLHDQHVPYSTQLYDLSLPYHQHTTYSTEPYYPPHCPTTSTRPTPPSPTTHHPAPRPIPALPPAPALLTALRPVHDLPLYSAIYPRSADPTYVHTAPISTSALSPATHTILHTAHTCHTPHRPAHLPHRCTMPPPYLIGSTTQPYLGYLYPPFSTATFIGLIRPIGLIGPTPTRARTGQVVGVIGLIGLIGAIGLRPP